jgi:hypothetical protein
VQRVPGNTGRTTAWRRWDLWVQVQTRSPIWTPSKLEINGRCSLVKIVKEYSQMKGGDHHHPNGHNEHFSMPME